MAALAWRIYASSQLLLCYRAADSYLPNDDEAACPGVPICVLTATFVEGTPEQPRRHTLTVCVSDSLLPTRFTNTHTPAGGGRIARGRAGSARMGYGGARRSMNVGRRIGPGGFGAGSWEGGLRAPVTAPLAAHLTETRFRPHAPHACTRTFVPWSLPFSSRVRCGWRHAPGGSPWCTLPGAEPRGRACGV